MITTPKNMITSDHDHVETISIDPKDDIKIEINDNDENNPNGTEEIFATDQDINNGQQISGFTMNLGPMNQALIQAQQNLLQQQYNISQGHSSSIYPSPSMVAPPKRSSINSLVETTGKRPRLDQPTIEVSLDNLSAIGKKEALMLTKEQIEMMLRINAPEVTLVQHIVRRPDLEKYWTYIRKINVNGHQTVWTQCTNCHRYLKYLSICGKNLKHYPHKIVRSHHAACKKSLERGRFKNPPTNQNSLALMATATTPPTQKNDSENFQISKNHLTKFEHA
jgi:septal ring-binding cell division protein DamX